MCDPMTAAAVAAMGAKVAEGIQANAAGKATYRAKQDEARQNMYVANIEAGRVRREGEAFLGQTRAIQAASGVDLATGSPADVGAESAAGIEEDAQNVLYGGRLQAHRAMTEGLQAKQAGKAAMFNAVLGAAGGTLLTAHDQGWFKSTPTPQPFSRATTASYFPKVGR